MSAHRHDVLVLGSGFGGSMLAAVLARQGLDVQLIESGSHPRFAIGEATTPDTSCRFKLLARKYSVPELANLATFHDLRDRVSPACGVKRAFSFLYHREGQAQRPAESHQFPTLAPPLGPDCHFFRQDTDSYLLAVALSYGARVRQRTRVREIELGDAGVTLTAESGERFAGRYLVDASGHRSPLADRLGLRSGAAPLRTRSRALFTHMIGVRPYDRHPSGRRHGLPYPLSQTTLHHVFAGGWIWVIPFNNHPDSTNPLCSVGAVVDADGPEGTAAEGRAEELFARLIARYPDVAWQFEEAVPVRDWVATGRLQYASRAVTGPRCCLLAHAAGFVDPLFSSGLNLTAATVDLLAGRLIEACRADDFSPRRFAELEEFFDSGLRWYDEQIAGAFLSFRDFDLWDAWFRVWVAGNFVATALATNLLLRHRDSGDPAWLDRVGEPPYRGVLGSEFAPHRELFRRAVAELESVREGAAEPAEAARRIRGLFAAPRGYLPAYYRWHDPRVRTTPTFTFGAATRLYLWYLLRADRRVRCHLMSWSPLKAYAFVLGSVLRSRRRAGRRGRGYARDAFRAWNRDWEAPPSGGSSPG